jgi:hypothetical protein
MESLSEASDAAAVRKMVEPMVIAYGTWITEQYAKAPKEPSCRVEITNELLHRANNVKERIAGGLNALADPHILEAFCLTNRVIATSIRQRSCHGREDISPAEIPPLNGGHSSLPFFC